MGSIQFLGTKILFDGNKIAFHGDCCCECEGCDCLDIVIAGVARDSPCVCSECYSLNGSYQVSQTAPSACAWSGFLCDDSAADPYKKCNAGGLTATVVLDSGTYYLRVNITGSSGGGPFSVLFEKNLGASLPDCTAFSSEICTYDSGNTDGTCDFSGATATVSYQAGACDTGDACDDRPSQCALCYDGKQPNILEVTIPDKFTQTGANCTGEAAGRCGESGTYLLEAEGGTTCAWNYIEGATADCSDFNVFAWLKESGGNIYLVVSAFRYCNSIFGGTTSPFHRWVKNVSTDYMDCSSDLDCWFDGDVVSVPFDCEGQILSGCNGSLSDPAVDCDPDNCGIACCIWTENTAITVKAVA